MIFPPPHLTHPCLSVYINRLTYLPRLVPNQDEDGSDEAQGHRLSFLADVWVHAKIPTDVFNPCRSCSVERDASESQVRALAQLQSAAPPRKLHPGGVCRSPGYGNAAASNLTQEGREAKGTVGFVIICVLLGCAGQG